MVIGTLKKNHNIKHKGMINEMNIHVKIKHFTFQKQILYLLHRLKKTSQFKYKHNLMNFKIYHLKKKNQFNCLCLICYINLLAVRIEPAILIILTRYPVLNTMCSIVDFKYIEEMGRFVVQSSIILWKAVIQDHSKHIRNKSCEYLNSFYCIFDTVL